MIDVHYVETPNGMKVTIMLEEVGLPYRIVKYDMFEGEHLTPAFRRINPNNKLPAIADHDPMDAGPPFCVFESGAILVYLAEKTGNLIPEDFRGRSLCQQWLTWQAANMGPMLGQAHHFIRYAPEGEDYGRRRYKDQALRIYDVLEYRLRESQYLAGAEYSIADIMVWAWCAPLIKELIGIDGAKHTATHEWFERVNSRSAVQRAAGDLASSIPESYTQKRPVLTPAQWSNMFGERMLEAAQLSE